MVSPNSGIRLPEITPKEILDFHKLHMVVECHVVASLAGCLTVEQAGDVEAILDEQEACAARADTVRYHQLDIEFHGNSEMAHALQRLRDKMFRLTRRMHGAHPERLAINAAQHRGIFDAVRAGNAAEATQRMRTHLDWGRRFTLDPDRRLAGVWEQLPLQGEISSPDPPTAPDLTTAPRAGYRSGAPVNTIQNKNASAGREVTSTHRKSRTTRMAIFGVFASTLALIAGARGALAQDKIKVGLILPSYD